MTDPGKSSGSARRRSKGHQNNLTVVVVEVAGIPSRADQSRRPPPLIPRLSDVGLLPGEHPANVEGNHIEQQREDSQSARGEHIAR